MVFCVLSTTRCTDRNHIKIWYINGLKSTGSTINVAPNKQKRLEVELPSASKLLAVINRVCTCYLTYHQQTTQFGGERPFDNQAKLSLKWNTCTSSSLEMECGRTRNKQTKWRTTNLSKLKPNHHRHFPTVDYVMDIEKKGTNI